MLRICISFNIYYDKSIYFDIFNKQILLANNSKCIDYEYALIDHFLFNLVCLINKYFESYFA